MQRINVLDIQRISAADRAKIEAVDPTIKFTDAGGWFDGEYRETWPAFSSARYLSPSAMGLGTREERDRLLADAEVILGGWPFPLDLRARAPKLKWFHQRPAGASNLLRGDLWGSDVIVTTSRGAGNTLAMAEYAVAGILYFAKGFPRAAIDRDTGAFSPRAYRPLLLEGKTACVVGAGGIGLEVGRLCAVLVNVARGEIIDEDALADALQRDHLRGVALDVYVGEFEHLPPARLWSDPRVLITPHVSGASDDERHRGVDLFCENLRAYLDGQPLHNVIDWDRGY